jgi:methylthioribose-1-phosphate isomerase
VVVGADRVAKNGDTANKIGTYSFSVLANYHKVPFYVILPFSSIDLNCPSGDKIVIEERKKEELTVLEGIQLAP